MLKFFNIPIPEHKGSQCFRHDLPISGNDEYVVGAFAISYSDNARGKLSISTDNGEVIHPSLVYRSATNLLANKLMQPVDFARIGNKLTIIVEDDSTYQKNGFNLGVFLKTRKRGK